MKEVVELLIIKNKTIATMESCTGGGIVNEITNIPGASDVLKYSAVTYSNEFKIKMGVKEETISKYTVYSSNVANEMSKAISDFTLSDYGVGVTGKLKRFDKNNLTGDDSLVFISIYDRKNNKYYEDKIHVNEYSRVDNKQEVINIVASLMLKILK